jgi:activator of HSP90 ATPase
VPTTIHQEIEIPASSERVYTTLTRAEDFQALSGMPAEIESQPGGAFKLFGGQITGRNIELVSNELIVQAWRPAMWRDGVYSVVRIQLEEAGDSTRVVLDHSGFPEEMQEHLSAGWHRMYWEPLKRLLVAP